jgi:hypothetical protein
VAGSLTIRSNALEVKVSIGKIPAAARRRLPAMMTKLATAIMRDLVDTKLTKGGILEPRTGQLRRSVFRVVEEKGANRVEGRVGFDLSVARYGRIHEFGGVITPKRAQNLTIPIGEALTTNGVARFTARELISSPEALGFTGSFVARHIMFGRRGGGDTGLPATAVPLFVLKKQVVMPARAPLSTTLANNEGTIAAALSQLVDDALVL